MAADGFDLVLDGDQARLRHLLDELAMTYKSATALHYACGFKYTESASRHDQVL